jgi:putative ABC transport system permease protein
MFRLNLKIAFRNLLKNSSYTLINVGGLSIGLTAFVLLLLFINHEVNYDSWNPELKNVYQLREKHDFFTPDNKEHFQDIGDTRIAALVHQQIPQFKFVTKVDRSWGQGFSLKIANADPVMVKNVKDSDSSFFQVFPHRFIQGSALTALAAPKSIVLKQSLAIKLFGTTHVLGKTLKVVMWRNDEGTPLTITGVVADPNTPESAEFTGIMRTGELDKDPTQVGNNHYSQVYALAGPDVDTAALNRNLQKVYIDFKKAAFVGRKTKYEDVYKDGKTPGLKMLPLHDVHATPPFDGNWFDRIKPMVALSVFLLLVSIINFINLATAQSVQRAKEVGVKKVLGAFRRQLTVQFLIESAIQSLAALFISTILVEVLLPTFNQQFDISLSFWHSEQLSSILLQLFGLFLLITFLAGFYPAWVLSSYNPVKVLKGNYETNAKGLLIRNGLVVLQFMIAVTFIIGIGVMHQQTSFIANKNLGFDRDQLVNISTNFDQTVADKIKRIPGVKYVATTTQVMGNTFNVPEEINYKNEQYQLNTVTVSMETLQALGVQLLSGRLFSPAYKQDTINSVVLNEAAAKLMDKNMVGKQYDIIEQKEKYTFQVVGVIRDYHNEGFDKAVLPTMYKVTHLGGTSSTNNLLVRFNTANYQPVMKAIEAEWKKLYPNYQIEYSSVEDAFQAQLKPVNVVMQIIMLFSIISVVLSLLGLFALSAFMAKRRTKEIAIRKILGASNLQVINMLNRSFLFLVITANLISWPIAFILTSRWLDGFAYRIDMPFFPFLLATILSIAIALITVSLQARKAAVSNPVDALKYE